jgi:hypothetical protein
MSWNPAGRTGRWPDQLAAVRRLDPDVAPQEVTSYTPELWREAFVREGWCSFVFSFELAPSSFSPTGPRRYGLVLTSRLPLLTHDPQRFPVPWQERVLSATIHVPSGSVEITTRHVNNEKPVLAGLELTPAAALDDRCKSRVAVTVFDAFSARFRVSDRSGGVVEGVRSPRVRSSRVSVGRNARDGGRYLRAEDPRRGLSTSSDRVRLLAGASDDVSKRRRQELAGLPRDLPLEGV